MISEQNRAHIRAYTQNNQILEAADYLISSFGLENENLKGFEFREDEKPNFIVVTTEGNFGEPQIMRIPRNLFSFDISLILNLFAHEMLHVRQKTQPPFVEDKNEREWQAYCEMLFHTHFPQIPDAPDFNVKQFCEQALVYYNRMENGGELQQKYAEEKLKVEEKLKTFLSEESIKEKP